LNLDRLHRTLTFPINRKGSHPSHHSATHTAMARSTISIAFFCLVVLLLRTSNGFTISLAPLLTTRLGLGPWGNNYVKNFSASPSRSTSRLVPSTEASETKTKVGSSQVKPCVQNFKFEYDDCRMISGCKSECLELIYARSLGRGFTTA